MLPLNSVLHSCYPYIMQHLLFAFILSIYITDVFYICVYSLLKYIYKYLFFNSGQENAGMTSSWGRTPQFGPNTPAYGSMTPSYGSMTPLPGGGGRTPMYGAQTPVHGDGKYKSI